jgi:hypothetical protein
MEQSQYHHFPSRARECVKAVMMPVGDRDHIRCFANQVKLTRALVQDLNETVKKVNLLGQHEEESSQKITELEALQEVEVRHSKAEAGEDHPRRNDPVPWKADHGDGRRVWTPPHERE